MLRYFPLKNHVTTYVFNNECVPCSAFLVGEGCTLKSYPLYFYNYKKSCCLPGKGLSIYAPLYVELSHCNIGTPQGFSVIKAPALHLWHRTEQCKPLHLSVLSVLCHLRQHWIDRSLEGHHCQPLQSRASGNGKECVPVLKGTVSPLFW